MIKALSFGVCCAVAATGLCAQDIDGAIKARKAHMVLYAHQLGILGGMAKGEVEYNAELASAVAGDLAKLSSLMQASYWPPGSDNGSAANTRLLPASSYNIEEVLKIAGSLAEAAGTLGSTAGDGLDALRAGMGPVGKACGDCHKMTRAPEN